MVSKKREDDRSAKNLDPITKEPGAHPVGTGVGATVGGVAGGAAVGAAAAAMQGAIAGTVVGGPIGTAVGAVAGIVAGAIGGGLAGKAIAESIDPTVEEAHWKQNYKNQPYVEKGASYDDYGPAYRYGWESRTRYDDEQFEDVESEMASNWDSARGKSKLEWERAKHASRDAWNRVCDVQPNDQGQGRHRPQKG